VPTLSPTPATTVSGGFILCCLPENLVPATTSLLAQALGLFNHQVKISSSNDKRGSTERDLEWEIIYKIELEESDSTEAIKTSLEDADVLNSMKQSISTDLGIELQSIKTTSFSQNQPTSAPTKLATAMDDSMGASIGGIIGAIAVIVLLCLVCYRFYIWKKLSESSSETESESIDLSVVQLELDHQKSIFV